MLSRSLVSPSVTSFKSFNLLKSSLSNFSVPFLYTLSGQRTQISKTSFSKFLQTPIHIESELKNESYRLRLQEHNSFSSFYGVNFTEVIFVNCTTEFEGGAAFLIVPHIFYCEGTSFYGCKASESGGCMFIICPEIIITKCCTQFCSSPEGGFVTNRYCQETISVNLTYIDLNLENSIESNSIFLYKSKHSYIQKNNFSNNHAVSNQGAPFSFQSDYGLTLSEIQFSSNRGQSYVLQLNTSDGIQHINLINFYNNSAQIIIKIDADYSEISNIICLHNFINNYFINNYFLDTVTDIQLLDSDFDVEKNKAFKNVSLITYTNCNFKVQSPSLKEISYVATHTCWHHSTYVYSLPPFEYQIIMMIFFGLIVIICIVIFFFHEKIVAQRMRFQLQNYDEIEVLSEDNAKSQNNENTESIEAEAEGSSI